ncbi:hypothetical protein OSTOST_15861, partial [Ostertagia ostertagi]
MKKCHFCGEFREEGDLRLTRSSKTILIMLCAMLEKGKLRTRDAQDFYNKSLHSHTRICKNHFYEAAYTEVTGYRLVSFHQQFKEDAEINKQKVCFELEEVCDGLGRPESNSTEKQLTPSSNSTEGSEGITELDETSPALLDKQFLIKGSQLLKLFRFCPSCGTKISDSVRCLSLTAMGEAPIVHYICTACHPFEKRFEGQETTDTHANGTSSGTNVQTAVVGVTENARYVNSRLRQRTEDAATQGIAQDPPLKQAKLEDSTGFHSSERLSLLLLIVYELSEKVVELQALVQKLSDRLPEVENTREDCDMAISEAKEKMQKWHCRICSVYREGNELRRSKSKKTVLIMLCGMVEKRKIDVQDAQQLYDLCLGSTNVRICRDHFCETASYISDTVASVYDGIVRNLFTIPGHIMKAIAARFESHRRGIDASISLTAYDLATFHRRFRDEGRALRTVQLILNASHQIRKQAYKCDFKNGDNYFELNPTHEDPICTESTSTERNETQLPISSASMSSNGVLELDETNPELLDKYFLIKGSQLLKLFRFCPSCGTRLSDSIRCVSLTAIGRSSCCALHLYGMSSNSRRRTGVKQAIKRAPRSLAIKMTRDEELLDFTPRK